MPIDALPLLEDLKFPVKLWSTHHRDHWVCELWVYELKEWVRGEGQTPAEAIVNAKLAVPA